MQRLWQRGRSVGVFPLVALAGLVSVGPLACKPAPPPPAPWSPAVTEVEGASWCLGDGTQCTPAAPGSAAFDKQLRTGPEGRALVRLDDEMTLELGPGASVAFVAAASGAPRTVELRGGLSQVRRAPVEGAAGRGVEGDGKGASVPARLAVKIADELCDLDPRSPTSMLVRARGEGRAVITVDRGAATFRRDGAGEGITLRAGETAAVVAGSPLDRRAGYAGEVARVETPERRSRTEKSAPRGLGTMTARAPGTEAVVGGVRLASHVVHAVVRNGYARTEVEEVFANDTDRTLEGRYVFAVPPRASVGRLALWVNDKLVEDEVVPRAKAASVFKGIVDDTVRPRDPALLEWVASGEVSLKVFPLPPRGTRKVVIAYDEALSTQGGEVRYVLPLSLGEARENRIGDLSVSVEVAGAEAPTEVTTPGYAAPVTMSSGGAATTATVTYAAKDAAPADDFVVAWREASRAPAEVAAYVPSWAAIAGLGVERITRAAGDESWAAVRVTAGLPGDAPAPAFSRKDRVIVIDRSLSQSRATLDGQLRVALGLLRALDPDERFALLACDSACDAYPVQGLAPAVESSLEAAEKWARGLAPGGSSDVAGSLLAAAAHFPAAVVPAASGTGPNSGPQPQLVVMGDGVPTSGELTVPQIGERVHPHLDGNRVDVRVLGAGVTLDPAALESLAASLSATYEPLSTGASLPERIDALASALRAPVIHGARLELPASMTEVYPHDLPALRLGQQITVLARLSRPEGEVVKLSGELDGKTYAFETRLSWQETEGRQTPILPRLWAARRIDALRTASTEPAQKETIALSQRFHVLTPLTSMLVLENDAMFAQMGIPRTTPRPDGSTAGGGSSPAAALAAQLDALQYQALGSLSGFAAQGGGAPDPARASPGTGGLSDLQPKGLGSIGGGTGGPRSDGGFSTSVLVPRANVSGSGSVISGKVAGVDRLLAGVRGRVRSCYQNGLASNPDMEGNIAFTLGIDASGAVSRVSAVPSGSLGGNVVQCVQRSLQNLSFDAPESAPAQVKGTFQLKSVARDGGPSPAPPAPPPSRLQGFVPEPAPSITAVIRPSDDAWRMTGDDAIARLRAAVEKSPTSRSALEGLIRGLLLRGRYEPALAEARRFTDADPDSAVARDLLAYASVVGGEPRAALSAIDAAVESDARSIKAHLRAAHAFESAHDERRACAHWRALATLSASDDHRVEALRCRARTLGDGVAALAQARSVTPPSARMTKLLPQLEAGQVEAFTPDAASPGQMEAKISCAEGIAECPQVVVIAPNGTVFSPATPADARTTATSVAFSGLRDGTYHVVLVGGAPQATGEVSLRAAGATQKLAFTHGGAQTLASVQVTLPPQGLARLSGLLGIGSGW